jgi:hypothetical protein
VEVVVRVSKQVFIDQLKQVGFEVVDLSVDAAMVDLVVRRSNRQLRVQVPDKLLEDGDVQAVVQTFPERATPIDFPVQGKTREQRIADLIRKEAALAKALEGERHLHIVGKPKGDA